MSRLGKVYFEITWMYRRVQSGVRKIVWWTRNYTFLLFIYMPHLPSSIYCLICLCIQVINVSRNLLCLNHLFVIIKICKESHGKIDTTQYGQNLYPCMDKISVVKYYKSGYLSHAAFSKLFYIDV